MPSSNLLRSADPIYFARETRRDDLRAGHLQDANDQELVRLCGNDDRIAREALQELARRFQTPLFRFLVRLMGSQEDAEEAVLEVFIRVWKHSGRFRYQASASTWLYRIAANIARDHHARRCARPQTDALDTDNVLLSRLIVGNAELEAVQNISRQERAHLLNRALETLRADDKLVLVLYYLEEMDYAEMQSVTGWIYPVLKTRLVRARVRLRAKLKALNFEEGL